MLHIYAHVVRQAHHERDPKRLVWVKRGQNKNAAHPEPVEGWAPADKLGKKI